MSPRDTVAASLRNVNWWTVAKALAALLVPVTLAAGFDFKTPSAKFAEIEARIDTVEHKVEHSDKNLEVVLKLSCIDPRYSARDRVLVGLRCDSLMSGAGR
jgi:hypothetical protein